MSDPDAADADAGPSPSLASSRSRRGPSKAKSAREAALLRMKSKAKYEVEEDVEDVYDVVDEKEYSARVEQRLKEDFIVDDDGEYVDDGREIFDADDDDDRYEGDSQGGKKRKRAPGASSAQEKKKEEERKKKKGNIRNLISNMGGKKKKEDSGAKNLDDDQLLESLLGEVKGAGAGGASSSSSTNLRKKTPSRPPSERPVAQNPFARPKSTGIMRPKQPLRTRNPEEDEDHAASTSSSALDNLQQREETPASSQDVTATQQIEEFDEQELSSIMDDDFIEDDEADGGEAVKENQIKEEKPEEEAKPANRGFQETKTSKKNRDLSVWKQDHKSAFSGNSTGTAASSGDDDAFASPMVVDVQVEQGNLPLTTNADGEKVLRMYWLDAHEDPFKHPGTVWLFGKVYIESAQAYVSCCLTVKNIQRHAYLLKREHRYDTKTKKEDDTEPVGIADVYEEFNGKLAERYKIREHRSKMSEKLYAFELADVPAKAQYLEIQYSPKYPALPSNLQGETFSRVFGANRSSLEEFLISRKIKGPGWLDVKLATASNPPSSWCKVEAVCLDPDQVNIMQSKEAPSAPPLTIMAINMKTTINPKTMLNEISLVSCLVHNEFYLDRAAPKQPFKMHFCAVTRPQDEVWPFDFQKVLNQQKNNKNQPKIDKMDTERALLGFLMAKIGKLDPDLILGHDITGFDIDVLLHRTVVNKIPHWSRLGRLRRSQPPTFKGRLAEKQAMTGRLVCDLKISAKELIRCKSYELGALVEKLLGKPQDDRIVIGCEEMRRAYENSQSLLHVATLSLQEAADTLQCVYDLNALPLALQITQVAGNVLSRTLLGGRAERNEFLLLHAFNERNYIVPDKQYGGGKHGKKAGGNDDDDGGAADESKGPSAPSGRKKPAYTGGLVLEPKKGFYDKFILLMDFNSLYPSIIQEYNICFTTVDRKPPSSSSTDPSAEFVPELPGPDSTPGILPTEIRKLVESRKAVKQLLKDPNLNTDQRQQYDIRQKALKLTANSMYGCLGFSHSRFFAKPLAAMITSRGREILLQTKDLVEKMNLDVVYGDTDSIMINSNSIDYDDVFKLGAKIKQEVNKMYKLLELDVDGVFRYMLLLKKKKYAAVTMERKSSGELVTTTELKGLDIVRRDWSQLAADAGKHILSKILSDCTADERVSFLHSTLEDLAEKLRSGNVPLSDLAITKQLTKNPEDYADKKSLPHVQVAVRMNSKGGKKLRHGDTVEYVVCDDGSGLAATQRAYHVDEVKERDDLKVDLQYYLAQQLHPVVSRLCDPLEGTDASRIAQCLGLDPENYRKASAGSGAHGDLTAEEESGMREEERFRHCEKFQVDCLCGETLTLDSAVRGTSERDRHLALSKCPNLTCTHADTPPIAQRPAYLQNRLTMALRAHLHRFYAGYVVCEDPACTGRTRQLPLDFKGAYPVCSACSKAVMVKEYSDKELYTQLLYYQQLFDVPRANLRYDSSFGDQLACIPGAQTNYAVLKQQVDRLMDLNRYSIVDMTKLFSGFAAFGAAAFRKSKNM